MMTLHHLLQAGGIAHLCDVDDVPELRKVGWDVLAAGQVEHAVVLPERVHQLEGGEEVAELQAGAPARNSSVSDPDT
jgi:hypothetical protein